MCRVADPTVTEKARTHTLNTHTHRHTRSQHRQRGTQNFFSTDFYLCCFCCMRANRLCWPKEFANRYDFLNWIYIWVSYEFFFVRRRRRIGVWYWTSEWIVSKKPHHISEVWINRKSILLCLDYYMYCVAFDIGDVINGKFNFTWIYISWTISYFIASLFHAVSCLHIECVLEIFRVKVQYGQSTIESMCQCVCMCVCMSHTTCVCECVKVKKNVWPNWSMANSWHSKSRSSWTCKTFKISTYKLNCVPLPLDLQFGSNMNICVESWKTFHTVKVLLHSSPISLCVVARLLVVQRVACTSTPLFTINESYLMNK